MFEPHEGTLQLKHKCYKADTWLEVFASPKITTKSGTSFIEKANITQKGPDTGEKVIRFMQDNKESARAYECCWGQVKEKKTTE